MGVGGSFSGAKCLVLLKIRALADASMLVLSLGALISNTTVRTPHNIFIRLPRSDKLRELWSNAAHRDGPLISASGSACCEDYFTVSSIVGMVPPSTLFIASLKVTGSSKLPQVRFCARTSENCQSLSITGSLLI